MEPLTLFFAGGLGLAYDQAPHCTGPDCRVVGTVEAGAAVEAPGGRLEVYGHHRSYTAIIDRGTNTVGLRYRAEITIGGEG